eukprot:gene14156-14520_t
MFRCGFTILCGMVQSVIIVGVFYIVGFLLWFIHVGWVHLWILDLFYLLLIGKFLLPFVLFADFLFIVRDAAAPNTPPKTAG